MRRPAFFLLLCAALACSKKADKAAGKAGAPPEGWFAYEDDWIRAAYPAGAEVVGAPGGKQDRQNPGVIITPADSKDTMVGSIGVTPEQRYKGMLLRDALASVIREYASQRGGIMGEMRRFPVKNAQCLSAVLMLPPETCPAGAPFNGQGTCYTPSYTTFCDGPDGNRYQVVSVLTRSRSKDSLIYEAQRQAVTYERFLATLEFKKPAP